MTSTREMANFIHLHSLALRKLQSETRRQEQHLRQLLGHVAVLESTDAYEYDHYVAPSTSDKAISTQDFASTSLASLVEEVEQRPSVEVTECSDDDDEDDIYDAMPYDDDAGLTSDDSASDSEHEDEDGDEDAEKQLFRCRAHCLDGGVEVGKAEGVCGGVATVVDVKEVGGKEARDEQGQTHVVSIVEWNDDGF